MEPQKIKDQYEALRTKLVDTSLRNNMLNFRSSKVYGAEIVEEDSEIVFRMLVDEEKEFSFTGKPDPPSQRSLVAGDLDFFEDADAQAQFIADATEELEGYLETRMPVSDQRDTKLNTNYTVSNLNRRLVKTFREAASAYEETGLHMLYLALGALHWKESDASDIERVAPLIFVPVELEKKNNGQFRLAHKGGDVVDNLSLVEKMKEFQIEIPRFDGEEDLSSYFQEVLGRIRHNKHWHIDIDWIALSFFQFSKIAMYLDLDESQWPPGETPTSDPDLIAILGDGYEIVDPGIGEDEFIDDYRPLESCHEVFNCDSSQALAILRAQAGHSMVIEGPPGTGKSQTIANLIAEFVGAGKKVLFVSEKMAALDVVSRRLGKAGLGDVVLELHSKASKRRAFYEELRHVMSVRAKMASTKSEVEELKALRGKLNAYCSAVNEDIEPHEISPVSAMGIASKLPAESADDIGHRIEFEDLKGFSWQELKGLLPVVTSYQSQLVGLGKPSGHPYYQANLKIVTPGIRLEIEGALIRAKSGLLESLPLAAEISKTLRLPAPINALDVALLATCAKKSVEAPLHEGVAVNAVSWEQRRGDVKDCIDNLLFLQKSRQSLGNSLLDKAWHAPAPDLLTVFERWVPRWWRILSGEYRKARKEMLGLLSATTKKTPQELLELSRLLNSAQECRKKVAAHSLMMKELFGAQFQGEDSDSGHLIRLTEWALELRDEVQQDQIPTGLLDFFSASHSDPGLLDKATAAKSAVDRAVDSLTHVYGLMAADASEIQTTSFEVLQNNVDRWAANLDRLTESAQLNVARANLRDVGLKCVVESSADWERASEKLHDTVVRSYVEGVLLEAIRSRPALQGFDSSNHEQLIARFQELDDLVLRINSAKVRIAHLDGMPNWSFGAGNLHQLKRQTELKRRHKPIRWAFENVGRAIQDMKPVIMMSPLSVSTFLPRGGLRFDALIFDEASQVKPEDALAAMARSDQSIVVGDDKQLPPMTFFEKIGDVDQDESDDVQTVKSLESILALMSSVLRGTSRSVDLRWHYRSLHPALIRPSNAEFYANRLRVFPSAQYFQSGENGLAFHYDPTHLYDRGNTRKNLGQAMAIAKRVFKHIESSPELSLGIIAFSKQQEEAIEDAIDALAANHSGVIGAFDQRHPHEKLFKKNLETVQGDERDVIFIGIGYGPDEHGKITMNFGPINADGGERRLNVLMTRARRRCEFFSSITAADIRLSENPALGLAVLRKFLLFAETGELDDPMPSGREAGSLFEEQVAQRLRKRGYEVDFQVGSLGFYIDMAVKHPSKPGMYVLGIECDGAMYHSARSARDRDKLRQTALESRGWNLHRIWSTDWWQDPEKELSRCVVAIETAVALEGDLKKPERPPTDGDPEFLIESEESNRSAAEPYVSFARSLALNGRELHDLPSDILAKVVAAVVDVEGPIHRDLLMKRIRDSAGLSRAGHRVQDAVNRGIDHALATALVKADGEFLLTTKTENLDLRNWSVLETPEKRSEWVSDIELTAATAFVIKHSHGVSSADAASAAWKVLGFRSCKTDMEARGMEAVNALLVANRAVQANGLIRAAE